VPARRRVESAEIRFGPALKALGACLLIGGVAVGYTLQQHENSLLRDRATKLTQAYRQLLQHNASMEAQRSVLAGQLLTVVQSRLPHLVPTRPGQVVVLPLRSYRAPDAPGLVRLAGGGGR